MLIRDFFILLGALAVTTLITIVAVESAIEGAMDARESKPIFIQTTLSEIPSAINAQTTIPIEALEPQNTERSWSSSVDAGTLTTVLRYRLKVKGAEITLNGTRVTVETGHIEVQEVRGDPDSKTINLPVVRLLAKSNPAKAPVFIVFDGPGLSNMQMQLVPTWILERHDVVLVGVRGVDGDVSLNIPVVQQALLGLEQAKINAFHTNTLGEALEKGLRQLSASGVRLAQYGVQQVVADMDEVRDAFGYKAIHVLGVGFGALVAGHFSQSFSERVLSQVLLAPETVLADWRVAQLGKRNWGDLAVKLLSVAHPGFLESDNPILGVLHNSQFKLQPFALKKTSTPTLMMVGGSSGNIDHPLNQQLSQAFVHKRIMTMDSEGQPLLAGTLQSPAVQRLIQDFWDQIPNL